MLSKPLASPGIGFVVICEGHTYERGEYEAMAASNALAMDRKAEMSDTAYAWT